MSPFKKIMNGAEDAAYKELQQIVGDYGYSVHVKVRLADVVRIEGSGINDVLYHFALKAHFDFLVCTENHDPIFVVEFDGPTHQHDEQRDRDSKKDEICKLFSLPLLRINTNHLFKKYNKSSLLKWVISAWELQKSFYDAQEKGYIPQEEDFDPIHVWHPGNTVEEVHPHWIALRARLNIKKLHEQNRLPVAYTCGFIFYDADSNYRGIEWIDVDGGKVVAVESAMRRQLFPISLFDLFSELMTALLYDKLIEFLKSRKGSVEPSEVAARVEELKRRFRFASSHSGPTRVNISMSVDDLLAEWKRQDR
jgi:hypothetical protein